MHIHDACTMAWAVEPSICDGLWASDTTSQVLRCRHSGVPIVGHCFSILSVVRKISLGVHVVGVPLSRRLQIRAVLGKRLNNRNDIYFWINYALGRLCIFYGWDYVYRKID